MGQVSQIEDFQVRLCDELHEYFWRRYEREEQSERLTEIQFRKVIERVAEQAFAKFENYSGESADAVLQGLHHEAEVRALNDAIARKEANIFKTESELGTVQAQLESKSAEVRNFITTKKAEIESFKQQHFAYCVNQYGFEIEKRDNIIGARDKEIARLQRLLSAERISAADPTLRTEFEDELARHTSRAK